MISDTWMFIIFSQVILGQLVLLIIMWTKSQKLKRNTLELETRCSEAQSALERASELVENFIEHENWQQQLQSRVTELKAKPDALSTIHSAVLNYELEPLTTAEEPGDNKDKVSFPDFCKSLETMLPQEDSDSITELENEKLQLQEQIETHEARIKQLEDEQGDSDPSTIVELKELVHKFTTNNRELLYCIQTLEAENKKLRNAQDAETSDAPDVTETPEATESSESPNVTEIPEAAETSETAESSADEPSPETDTLDATSAQNISA
ncbi:MAG: hypothetical protein KUG75_16140 [Pseudomonadales bacterium]|nr:hypothetical protein [Pseudomonadales bacterium]